MQACGMSVLHAKLCIIHQCLGRRAQVVSGPDHHRFLVHQADDGQLTDIAHHIRRLLAGGPTRNAWLDAEQWMGAVFALIERCLL